MREIVDPVAQLTRGFSCKDEGTRLSGGDCLCHDVVGEFAEIVTEVKSLLGTRGNRL